MKQKKSEKKSQGTTRSENSEMSISERGEIPGISLSRDKKNKQVTRRQVALDTLMRYSGSKTADFQEYVLLTNFPFYVDAFSELLSVPVTMGTVLKAAHCPKRKISIIDYRVGAPMAALVIDVLSYTKPQAVIMLGLCGGLHRNHNVGDYLIPVAAIRDEGASRHYMPSQVPSLPAFMVQQMISQELIEKKILFDTGVLHSTDYRMWEFDKEFKDILCNEKASAIDMECSALFTAGFSRKVPVGALMLISDLPMKLKGIKTKKSSESVLKKHALKHLKLGLDSVSHIEKSLRDKKLNLRRFQF